MILTKETSLFQKDAIDSAIKNRKSIHTLNTSYSYTYSDLLTYSAEGYSGTWNVSSVSGVENGDTVRLKVQISNMGTSGNPVYAYVLGTVTAINTTTPSVTVASHGLDSTVIDGGNIITGSIGANQIAANAITASKLSIGAQPSDNLFLGAAMDDRSTFTYNSDTDFTKHFRYYNGSASNHTFTEYEPGVIQDTIALSSGNIGIAFVRLAEDFALDSTANYTISCWAKCTSANLSLAIGLSYYKNNAAEGEDPWVWRGGTNTTAFNAANTWQKFTLTFKPDANTKAICYCFTVNANGANETFTIRNCKLEKTDINRYVTDISGGGIRVHRPNDTSNCMYLTSGGISIYYDNVMKAAYGADIRLYKDSLHYIKLDSTALYIYKEDSGTVNENDPVARFGSWTKIGKDSSRHVDLDGNGMRIFKATSNNNDNIIANLGYGTTNTDNGQSDNPYFSLGSRTGASNGAYSLVAGKDCVAVGYGSFAGGIGSQATGNWTLAWGSSEANNGFTHAAGTRSIAIGDNCKAYGHHTLALGYNTIAGLANNASNVDYMGQTVIGRSNAIEPGAFLIGGGSSKTIFRVDWQGRAYLQGHEDCIGESYQDSIDAFTIPNTGADSSNFTSTTVKLTFKPGVYVVYTYCYIGYPSGSAPSNYAVLTAFAPSTREDYYQKMDGVPRTAVSYTTVLSSHGSASPSANGMGIIEIPENVSQRTYFLLVSSTLALSNRQCSVYAIKIA